MILSRNQNGPFVTESEPNHFKCLRVETDLNRFEWPWTNTKQKNRYIFQKKTCIWSVFNISQQINEEHSKYTRWVSGTVRLSLSNSTLSRKRLSPCGRNRNQPSLKLELRPKPAFSVGSRIQTGSQKLESKAQPALLVCSHDQNGPPKYGVVAELVQQNLLKPFVWNYLNRFLWTEPELWSPVVLFLSDSPWTVHC